MKRFLVWCVLSVLVAGCSSVPFQELVRVPMSRDDPEAVIEQFRQRLPQRFGLLNSIVFKFNRFKQMSAIGSITMDTGADEFTVVCMNPLGLKLFEIEGRPDGTNTRFVIARFADEEAFAEAVAEDIKRVYLDLVPSGKARAKKEKYRIIFEQPFQQGSLRYVFGGPHRSLVQKRFYHGGRLLWQVAYYDYRVKDDKLFPGGVVLNNYQYGYELVVRLKEVYTHE